MDVKRLARFWVPGHRATGSREEKERNRGAGYEYLPCVVDDHSRLAYVELHPRESAETNARTLERALRFFAELGLDPPEAVMTDNAFVSIYGRRFKQVLAGSGAKHIRIPKRTPRWNGKVERFIQTAQNKCAYARLWPNSHQRPRALPSFIRYYNRYRPHSPLEGLPPISRVHNLRRQDT
jgi:transposase InsO family protein